MKTKLFYSENYDIRMLGLDFLHPFDGKKFSKAWGGIQSQLDKIPPSDSFEGTHLVDSAISDEALSLVHSRSYLNSLTIKSTIAQVVEVKVLNFLPLSWLQMGILEPARFAATGTLNAAEYALRNNAIGFNLGGGFHHAFREKGEGFCFFSDAPLAIESLKSSGELTSDDRVLMIDLDAHRGNGFESYYPDKPNIGIFDLYNAQAYPGLHPGDVDDYPFIIPLRAALGSEDYLDSLYEDLPKFLDIFDDAKLAFYNAGTDIIDTDRLGGLKVSYDAVRKRDRFVIEQLIQRKIPTVIMTSGGYSKDSYKLIADLALDLIYSGGA